MSTFLTTLLPSQVNLPPTYLEIGEWKHFERVLSFKTHKGSLVTNQTER